MWSIHSHSSWTTSPWSCPENRKPVSPLSIRRRFNATHHEYDENSTIFLSDESREIKSNHIISSSYMSCRVKCKQVLNYSDIVVAKQWVRPSQVMISPLRCPPTSRRPSVSELQITTRRRKADEIYLFRLLVSSHTLTHTYLLFSSIVLVCGHFLHTSTAANILPDRRLFYSFVATS